MNASSHRNRYARLGAICLTTATLVIGSALPAWAIIPELSATMNNPSPNPVPAGSTATATATFSLSADSGPITVGIELPDTSFGTLRLDTAGTGAQLTNCVEGATTVTCDWDGLSVNSPQTLSVFVDVGASVTPGSGANISAIASSATEPVATYSTNGLQAAPPLGSVTLSGTVITEGGAPVSQACIYILTSPPFVIPTLTDSAGQWQVTNLPDSYSYAIGVIPPFDLGFGPCANNGPPPIPAPGALQPVFIGDIWVDLSDPNLTGGLQDPFTYAVNAGATVFTGTNTGLQACLSTAPGSVVPRPPCIAAVTTTTTAPATTTTAEILPVTGTNASPWLGAGSLLLISGLVALAFGGRVKRPD